MRITFAAAALLLLSSTPALPQGAEPERQVAGQTIRSERDPAVRIELPKQAQYVGAKRWTLYDVADCELHLFVEADPEKRVQRLYWIQFEGYIPSRPDLHYDYSSNGKTEFAGREFFVSASAGEANRKPRAGSDFEEVQRLLRTNGYTLPDHTINVRLVNLFEDNRKELMFIYGEDMTPLGLTPTDVQAGGKAEAQWPKIERKLLDNAKKRIKIEWEE